MGAEPGDVLVLRPSRKAFSQPFCKFVSDVLAAHPGVPVFKVVPPRGYAPRAAAYPPLEDVTIGVPIKQHALGSNGAFRCFFEEQKALSVADFKALAYSEAHRPPSGRGQCKERVPERAFWSAVTTNAPLYGADTPTSFFDGALPWGWNLRDLQDLLKEHDVPAIPGVTSPMTYIGMWKSFFCCHVEDVDLCSINYLHFGAPKVWYCVAPRDRPRLEAMARALFPELASVCPAFLRHKDLLFSPRLLRAHNIDFVQVRQAAGEFVVLNAGAYHSGFNLGFNCAEAVNFATRAWLRDGARASRCSCSCLGDDAVRLDMRLFERRTRSTAAAEASSSDSGTDGESEEEEESERAVRGGAASCSGANQKRRGAGACGAAQRGRPAADGRRAAAAAEACRDSGARRRLKRPCPGDEPSPTKRRRPGLEPRARAAGAAARGAAEAVDDEPLAIVGERGPARAKFFHLVQRLAGSSKGGRCRVRLLAEGADGLFRPAPGAEPWAEAESALVRVRTAAAPGGAFRLLTLRRRILDTELLD